MSRGVLRDGLRLAVGTLTVLPVPPPGRVDRAVGGTAMVLAVVAALVPGGPAAAVAALGAAGALPVPLAAVLTVAALTLGTRGLHLDGLADTVDGLSSGYDRDRALAVMRTGDVGPLGAVAVVLVLAVQTTSLAAVLATTAALHAAILVLGAVLVSRAGLVVAAARPVPAARPGGLGAAVAGTVPVGAGCTVLGIVALAGALAGQGTGLGWWRLPAATAVGVLVAVIVVSRCVRRLGGVTGDVLGAVVELTLAAALAALAVTG